MARIRPFVGSVKITQEYGVSAPGTRRGYHTGVDYGLPQGTAVIAPEDGVVQQNGDGRAVSDGRGYFVLFKGDSGTMHCLYHLRGMGVANGRVSQGTVLGYSGNTGASSGPHLHWETRKAPYDGNSDYAPGTWLFADFAAEQAVQPVKPTKQYVRVFGDYRTLYRGVGTGAFQRIAPNQFGGHIDYEVHERSGNFAKITTSYYGPAWIYVGADVAHLTQFYSA